MADRSVLVVEDNPTNLKLARTLLELEGFRVRSAADAEQALAELARAAPPDGMLVDIQLPGISGVELARRVRRDPALEGLVLIALTAYAMKGDEPALLAAGFDAYVAKPIDQATFAATVAAHLDRGAAAGGMGR